jgi:pteridine reductase
MTRTALITGAARRIGAHLAETLAANGYRLHLHTGRDRAELRHLAARLRDRYEAPVNTHVIDFADPVAVRYWVQRLRRGADPPELIINNASTFAPRHQPIDAGGLPTALGIHLLTPVALLDAFPPDTTAGHMVNLLDARMDLLDSVRFDYELTKLALRDYTLLAAKRSAPRVRINAIAPGLVLPPRGRDGEHLDQLARQRAVLRHPACLADLGAALLFLDRTTSITGQIIFVDAGEHLGPPTAPAAHRPVVPTMGNSSDTDT